MTSFGLHPGLAILVWALLHFLWEGAVLGLLAWGALHLARRRSPEARYALAYGALLLMALAFLATLMVLAQTPAGADVTILIQDGAPGATALLRKGWMTGLRQGLEAALPLILLAWCLGASLRLVRLGTGYYWLHQTCLKATEPASPAWEARLAALVRTLGLPRPVRILVSHRLDTPLVLGTFRPVILVPLAAILGLDAKALEAVLVHELAHIRRHDYLANLLQCFAETLFFYHPALWWVSRQIRLERELCCDDAAVRCCGDALLYASALAGLEALRSPKPQFIHLAPAAKGGPLMLRIRRILTPQTPLPAAPSLTLLSGLALTLVLALVTFGQGLRAETPPPAPEVVDVAFDKVKVAFQPPAPPYPAEAKAQRIQGTVVVQVTIDGKGTPTQAKALSGREELIPTAEAYAIQWRFEPMVRDGKAVAARFTITMPFKLR